MFRKAIEALIAEERAKRHTVLADRIAEELNRTPHTNGQIKVSRGPIEDLVVERAARRELSDLILAQSVRTPLEELVEEQHRADLLRAHNLEPRHRVLLTGPPGNGKTSVAEGLASALMVPLVAIRYDGVIGSYLGETATRLRRVFEYVRTRPCVLFFDEFDTLGKERGDEHDSGEIKRVVSSLLLQVDDLPPYVVVVTATNHPELLDRAVWRRFQLRLELPQPSRAQVCQYIEAAGKKLNSDFGYAPRTLADKLVGGSYAEIEEFVTDVVRRHVLTQPADDLKAIVKSRLEQWSSRVER
ncbi:MAG: AAA family ATPase [Phycisphaerales bacterium JB038]